MHVVGMMFGVVYHVPLGHAVMEIYDGPDDMWSFFLKYIVTSCLDRYVPLKKVESKYSN